MKTKLTLTIEKSIVEQAKIYAKNKNVTLSDLIENYLISLINDKQKFELSPTLKSLKGGFKLPKNFNYKKELTDILVEKYLP